MASNYPYKIFLGTVLNPISDTNCEVYTEGALILRRKKGKIYQIQELTTEKKARTLFRGRHDVEYINLKGHIILPGMFDIHFHWVQDDVRTMGKANLLEWLDKYTFPAEAKFKDRSYTIDKSKKFTKRLLEAGTLGGSVYSSVHGPALDIAMNDFLGDFAIGNVLMNMNSPKSLQQTKGQALKLVKKFSEKYKRKYVMTPRFAPTTHPELMKEAAKIAHKHGSFIQSHLAETPNEIEYVMSLYKNIKGFEKVGSYTEIYKKAGVLGKRTIMGHGIYLSQKERDILAQSGTAIAHCPTSNAPVKEKGLGSGLCDFKALEKAGVRWALASDIGGGPYLSMFDVMRSFVEQNKKAGKPGATYVKALYRATMAGAEIMALGKTRGNFLPGKRGNFIVVKHPLVSSKNLIFKIPKLKAEDLLAKVIQSKMKKRADYIKLVQRTYYNGELWYKR